jgi:hypothetical protein
MRLELDDGQVELLREVLDVTLRDLRYEIADTDNSRFRDELKEREQALRDLLIPLGGPLPD